MKNNSIQRRFRIAGIAFSLVFGFMVLSATTASAQYRDNRRNDNQNTRRDDRDDNNRSRRDRDDNDRNNNGYYGNNDYYGNNNYNNLMRQGYSDGLRQGMEDARQGDRYNPQKAAGRAMGRIKGNNGRYGNQGQMKQTYREGFMRGYEEGYGRYDNRRNRGNSRGRWGF